VPGARRGFRRAARISCFAGALGLAVAGVATAPGAGAQSAPQPPSYTYSSTVAAIGLQTALFSNPEPSSVPDLTDVQTPSSDGQLDSFGTSEASGHVGNLNGLGQLPSLICLASAAFCNAIPASTLSGGLIKNFPPPDPLGAYATNPAHQNDSAPAVGSKQASVKVKSGPFSVGAANADAHADGVSTSTSAVDSNLSILGGVSIGSIKTTTSQRATPSGLVTTATSQIGNIDIGTKHLLHIGSARSTLRITSVPGKPATDNASSVISGVTVLGKAATLTRHGVKVKGGPGVPAAVSSAYQKVLDTAFKTAGFGIKQASISRSTGHTGHTVTVGGLVMFFTHTVKGTPPITIGLPQGVPCPIKGISSKLPVDPCAGVGLPLNAKYRGQIAFGQVSAVSLAQPATKIPNPSAPPATTPPGGGNGGTSRTGATGGGSTNFGGTGPGGSTSVTPPIGQTPPAIAASPQSLSDPLKGLSGRLWWFFPLAAIGVLALAGRLRVPARFPGVK
jgi:hypothetical protein